jgi:hypothetical protein
MCQTLSRRADTLPIANCLLTKEAPVETGADHIRKSSVSAMKKIDKVNGV